MGIKITLSSVQFLAKPVVEHQFNVINDFAEEIAFRNFIQHHERTLIDGFAVKLEVDGAHNLVLLQRGVQFGGVEHVARFQIFHAATRNGQIQIFIHTQGSTVIITEPDWL